MKIKITNINLNYNFRIFKFCSRTRTYMITIYDSNRFSSNSISFIQDWILYPMSRNSLDREVETIKFQTINSLHTLKITKIKK